MPTPFLKELGNLVCRAGKLAQSGRQGMSTEFKPDGSIVTSADRDVESFLRVELPALIDRTGIWGEEFGWEAPGINGMWLVDPIDGTSNFSCGHILWGVTVALVHDDKVQSGAIYLPDIDELYLAQAGEGAWFNGSRIPEMTPGPVKDHELVSYDDGIVRPYPESALPGKQRLSGAFVVDGAWTSIQRFRGMIGRREHLYDIAACLVLNQEAGAEIRNADGTEFALKPLIGGAKVHQPWIMFPKESGFYFK
jgi:myo-inositol-1(or 4)-monophosphatase